ncbi:MAG: trypsin-like peptidase domain-containing protein [Bauldia sp.]|uniref:trypsin-like peptidase domain-containing protein n=1 Tax=Bauldia sp. TaxID=2575872 RepID=UPI001DA523C1|nr:trypsin-like peptidase domain-containing protein [Bauldia sp.]MCB1497901.1 trypsin-like peptidase domain-containing protein [Bauldia sp.]
MDFSVSIESLGGGAIVKGPAGTPADSSGGIGFDPGKDEIVFGREPASDVVFAPEDRIVSRKHFRLYRQPSGHYAIEVFGNRYVALNGTPASSGEHVSDGDILQLGSKDGPKLKLRLKEVADAGGMDRTLTQAKVVRSGVQFKQLRRVVGSLAIVVLVAGVGGYFYLDQQAGRLDALATLQEAIGKKVSADFSSELVARMKDSAYAVVLVGKDGSRTLLGTAWPVGEGMVATNAHVAAQYDPRGTRKLLVIHPGNTIVHTVTAAWIHPGYAALKDFRSKESRADPDFKAAFEGLPQPSGFDVAVLDVDNADKLGAPLELASPEEIAALGPGAKLAYVGYPVEGTTGQRTAADNPEPLAKFGYASSITDFFLFNTDPARAYLIRHSIPATGGASGSPIFNEQGHVVAILSGGTVFDTGGARQPSAVLENFAQRADLLNARLDPGVTFNVEDAVAYWHDTVLPRFGRHRQQIVADAAAALEDAAPGQKAVETLHLKSSLGDRDAVAAGPVLYREHEISVEPGKHYSIVAYGELGRPLSIRLFRGDEAVGFAGTGTSFATVEFVGEANETLTVRVLGEKNDPVDYELFVMVAENANTAEQTN